MSYITFLVMSGKKKQERDIAPSINAEERPDLEDYRIQIKIRKYEHLSICSLFVEEFDRLNEKPKELVKFPTYIPLMRPNDYWILSNPHD